MGELTGLLGRPMGAHGNAWLGGLIRILFPISCRYGLCSDSHFFAWYLRLARLMGKVNGFVFWP